MCKALFSVLLFCDKMLHMTTLSVKKKPAAKKRNMKLIRLIRDMILMPKGFDGLIYLCMIGLALFGTIMVGSATMGIKTGNSLYLAFTIIKQIVFATLGYIMMALLANRFQLKWLKSRNFVSVIILTFIALFACLAFKPTSNAHAWLRASIGGMEVTIQPSEFAKIIAMLIVAAYCGDVKREYKNWFEMTRVPIMFCGGLFAVVLLVQSDFGSALVIFLITCICFLIPEHKNMYNFQRVLKILFWLSVAFAVYLLSPMGEHMIEGFDFLKDYQKERFLSAFNPFADPYGNSYQLINGLISFSTGGWLGTGFGSSVRKYTNFPAANTDYILAIVVEELGYAGFCFLMLLYCTIIFQLFRHATRIKSEKARIILIGTAMYLMVHMFFNIGGVTGLVPLTGIPLLMISAGGSSTMSFMMAVGISQAVISAYRRGEIQ